MSKFPEINLLPTTAGFKILEDETRKATVYVTIEPDPDDEDKSKILVDTMGIKNTNELVSVLLAVVESVTCVKVDTYVHLVNEVHCIAAVEQEREKVAGEGDPLKEQMERGEV